MARALQMSMGSRLGSCDPLAFTVRPRDLPVKRRRAFQSTIWPAEGLLGEETHHRGLRLLLPYARRSEEHTSALQSLMRISYAVFCLNKNNKLHSGAESNPSDTDHPLPRPLH